MPRSSSRSPLPRRRPALASLAPIAVLALVIAGCGSSTATSSPSPAPTAPPSPSQPAGPSPTPAPTVTSPPATPAPTETGATACAPTDVQATSGGWEAAAGSRMAEVTVANQGDGACTLASPPAVAVLDAGGNPVLESTSDAAGPGVSLEPGAQATFALQFGNWCDAAAAFPLRPVLVTGAGTGVTIDGLELATTDDAPPCNGPGQEPVLATTAWEN